MALDRITLSHFRNHADTRLDDTAHLNLLVGENGAGKTNVLEALSLLAPGRGLRRATLDQIASAEGGGGFAVSARLLLGEGTDAVMLGTGTAADRPNRRIASVNGAETGAMAFSEWLAVSWLTPAMDRLFSDSAGNRRRYMDRLSLALDPGHARIAARYEAALRERNRLLANEDRPDPQWLDSIEAQMALTGASLAQVRARTIARLSQRLAELPDHPFAWPLLTYVPGGASEADELAAQLAIGRPRDLAARRSLTGPHRDELDVAMSGRGTPAASCSTGEQKAMLIAMTLAHAELAAADRPGLLLLDEVAAHLDPVRRAALYNRLDSGRAQVWLTGTEMAPFQELSRQAAIWRVSSGSAARLTS